MRVVTKDEFLLEMNNFFSEIFKGSIFIYPTDTIYGIGCNAKNSKAVAKIREIKSRKDSPFSVIAPSKAWIEENCVVDDKAKEWLDKLPGPYTLILKLKKKDCVAKEVNLKQDTIGVRIPQHWISKIVSELAVPIITTSVNESGDKYVNSLDEIDHSISSKVNFMIDEGEKKGKPSNIIHLEGEQVIVKKRN